MADTKIQLPPDSTGASVDTVDVTTGAGVVKREVVSLGDPTTGANRAVVTAAGKLLVTPDSVALPANQSVNAAQLAGTATSVNSGTKDAGTLRVVLATDQPALTNKLLVTPDSVALPANQSVNAAQFGGTNIVTGAGASGAGIPRVTVSNDSSLAANQSVNLNQVGAAAITEGQKTMVVFVFATLDLIGLANCWFTSFCVPPATIRFPTRNHVPPPGRFVVVMASVAVPASAAVALRVISMAVI